MEHYTSGITIGTNIQPDGGSSVGDVGAKGTTLRFSGSTNPSNTTATNGRALIYCVEQIYDTDNILDPTPGLMVVQKSGRYQGNYSVLLSTGSGTATVEAYMMRQVTTQSGGINGSPFKDSYSFWNHPASGQVGDRDLTEGRSFALNGSFVENIQSGWLVFVGVEWTADTSLNIRSESVLGGTSIAGGGVSIQKLA